MEIRKINLQVNGLKGAHVTWLIPKVKKNRTEMHEHTEKAKHPIHLALETPFKDLRFHLLEICDIINEDMNKDDRDSLIADCEVSGIRLEREGFVIVGKKRIFGTKSYQLETPVMIAEDEYVHFDTVLRILDKIIEETRHYINGEVVVTDEELAQRWIESGKSKKIDINAFRQLSKEEQLEITKEILESDFGAMVLMPDDASMENISDNVINEQLAKDGLKAEKQEEEKETKIFTIPAAAEKITLPK